eukprot:m.5839 g.5839  ORF g.5839 m.5839 type:complete len:75 (-) comp3419_c0_seq1:220-444(-)
MIKLINQVIETTQKPVCDDAPENEFGFTHETEDFEGLSQPEEIKGRSPTFKKISDQSSIYEPKKKNSRYAMGEI